MRAVHCVSASTKTRSKKSSSGVTRSSSRMTAVRCGLGMWAVVETGGILSPQQVVQFAVGGVARHLEAPERLGVAGRREAAAVLREDERVVEQQPRQQLPRDAAVVRAGLAVVAERRRERQRAVAADVAGELALGVGDVGEHALAPAAEHLLGAAVGVERADLVRRRAVADQPVAAAGLELEVPAADALEQVE